MFDEDGNYIPGSIDQDSGTIMGMPAGIDEYFYPEEGGVIGGTMSDWGASEINAANNYGEGWLSDDPMSGGAGYWEKMFGHGFDTNYKSASDAMGDGVNLAGTAKPSSEPLLQRLLSALAGGGKSGGFDWTRAGIGALAAYMKARSADKADAAGRKAIAGARRHSPAYSASLNPTATGIGSAPSGDWRSARAPGERFAQGGLAYFKGGSSGQGDEIPAMLSHGEYVFDADVVAALGDGNNEAGAAKLDKMRENIRKHKRGASAKKIPPKAKQPEQYLKGAK